jgi:NADH-quinone oxidoreductase subunit E
MSVRRLDPVQPDSFAFTAENLAWAKRTIGNYPPGKQASAVIPILWRAQVQNGGWVSRPAMEEVAKLLDMSFIRVYEVATFYTMFQLSPVGRKAHVQVCGTTPCMLRGSEELMDVCRRRIHREPHRLSDDGDFSWEEVECLGACVNAPMVQIWKDTYEDLTAESFEKVLDGFAADDPPKPGPQNGRQYSMPLSGATTLFNYGATKKPSKPKTAAPVVTLKPTKAPAATKAAAKKSAPAKKEPKSAAGVPALLKKPKGGKGDDLKLIWGVGKQLEKMLNRMGIWHFNQMASWSAKELSWVDERLEGFKGRAKRDKWISQARRLAKGWRPRSGVGERPK